jgi:hypothetical protein
MADFFYELINWSDGDDLPWFTDQFLISKIKLIGQWSLPYSSLLMIESTIFTSELERIDSLTTK